MPSCVPQRSCGLHGCVACAPGSEIIPAAQRAGFRWRARTSVACPARARTGADEPLPSVRAPIELLRPNPIRRQHWRSSGVLARADSSVNTLHRRNGPTIYAWPIAALPHALQLAARPSLVFKAGLLRACSPTGSSPKHRAILAYVRAHAQLCRATTHTWRTSTAHVRAEYCFRAQPQRTHARVHDACRDGADGCPLQTHLNTQLYPRSSIRTQPLLGHLKQRAHT